MIVPKAERKQYVICDKQEHSVFHNTASGHLLDHSTLANIRYNLPHVVRGDVPRLFDPVGNTSI